MAIEKDPLAKLPTNQKLDSIDSLTEECMRIARDEMGVANPVVKKQLHLLDQVKAYAKGVRKDVEAAAARRDAEQAEMNRQIDSAKVAPDVPPEPPPAISSGQSAAKRR